MTPAEAILNLAPVRAVFPGVYFYVAVGYVLLHNERYAGVDPTLYTSSAARLRYLGGESSGIRPHNLVHEYTGCARLPICRMRYNHILGKEAGDEQ